MLGKKTFLYFCQSDYVHRRTSLDSSSIFCHGGGRLVFSLEHLVLFGNWPKKWEIKDLRKLAIFYKFFACVSTISITWGELILGFWIFSITIFYKIWGKKKVDLCYYFYQNEKSAPLFLSIILFLYPRERNSMCIFIISKRRWYSLHVESDQYMYNLRNSLNKCRIVVLSSMKNI